MQYFNFEKMEDESRIEVTVIGTAIAISGGSLGPGIEFRIRVNEEEPSSGVFIPGALENVSTTKQNRMTAFAMYDDLPAGSHRVSVWARSQGAVVLENVGLSAQSGGILVKEVP